MRRVAAGCVLAALLVAGAAPAVADPVQQFSVQLKDVKPDGRYTVVYTSNSFDTTGDQPPSVTEASVRLAKGITIKPRFRQRSRLCEHPELKGMLIANQTQAFQYQQMLDDLRRTRRAIGDALTAAERRVLDTCIRAQIGTGRVKVDVRPLFGDLIPAFLYLFLSPPTEPGALVGLGIMSVTDRSAPVVRDNDIVAQQKPSFTVNVLDEPTPDGLYGYRLKLPPGNVGLIKISIAELRVETAGITDVTETRRCLRRRGGRCVRSTVTRKTDFWATEPACPASGRVQFQVDFAYETGQRASEVSPVPCPRFVR